MEDLVIAVVGLGYVGLPLAYEFAKKRKVIGFDINRNKISLYKQGIDPTMEVGDEEISKSNIIFSCDENDLKKAGFIIIAVPTPVNQDKTPDLSPIKNVSYLVGKNLSVGMTVVYESTVYPGVTEDVCIPILEKESGLKCGQDFFVGYSPERINPGDKIHRLKNIKKIVSGQDERTLKVIKEVYDLIIEAGTFPVSSIKAAEAIKVAENSQRDINIAFINELAKVFDRMGIDTNEVVDGMNTKWNALGFRPGLVGGHCIGVDPYYFVYQAEKLGYHSQIILNGRQINDSMGEFVAESAIKQMILAKQNINNSKILVLGITFKENCPDIRNTKVMDVVNKLKEYDMHVDVADAIADPDDVFKEYNINLVQEDMLGKYSCIVLAVAHDKYKSFTIENYKELIDNENGCPVIIDIKGILSKSFLDEIDCKYWRL